MLFYSRSTNGFYDQSIHAEEQIPDDAVEVTAKQYAELFAGQADGKLIQANGQGFPVLIDPPPLTLEQEKAVYSRAVQGRLDAIAVEHGYDDIKTAVTYADEPAVPKFQRDGQAFRAWRSLVWAYVYEQLDLVLSGKRQKPSVDQLLAELPLLTGI